MTKYTAGQVVTCNGNKEGRVVAVETNFNNDGFTMYTVRLWEGSRLIGDVVASESQLSRENC